MVRGIYTLPEMADIKNMEDTKCWWGYGGTGAHTADGTENGSSPLGNNLAAS